jgi:glycosyltransferase involved in cell wall biosynthesis
LEQLTKGLGIERAVSFVGWLSTAETFALLQRADVMVFPSLREFGGTVVFEALSLGTVPVVADFGGPGDIVKSDVGYRIPLINESDMLSRLEAVLKRLAGDRTHLEMLRQQGTAYARKHLTWEGKARAVTDVLLWVTGRGLKPSMQPPDRPAPLPGHNYIGKEDTIDAIDAQIVQE